VSRRRRTGPGNPGRLTTGRAGTDIATGDRAWWSLASSRADDFVGRTRHTKTNTRVPPCPGRPLHLLVRRRGQHVLERGSIILLGSQYLPARRVHLGQCGTDGVESDEPVRFEPCIMVAPGAESVAGSGAVAGDRQPPPVPWRHRGDRRIHPLGGGRRWCPARAAHARHRGQRPGGVIAVGRQRSAGRIFDAGLGR
jgi:hypothetical protein